MRDINYLVNIQLNSYLIVLFSLMTNILPPWSQSTRAIVSLSTPIISWATLVWGVVFLLYTKNPSFTILFSCADIFFQHWHGLFQARTSDMDGPAFVNQCPIPPNTTFVYDFSVAEQTGKSVLKPFRAWRTIELTFPSFWYHSHLSTQYCDGLRGAIVIYGTPR